MIADDGETNIIDSTTTQFLYDGLNPVQGPDGGNGVVANLLTALRIDEYFSRTDSAGNVSSFLADALGSTVGLVGSGGTVATGYTYEPSGNVTASGAANGNSSSLPARKTTTRNCITTGRGTTARALKDSPCKTQLFARTVGGTGIECFLNLK
jgi:hypothetical protein